MFSADTGGATRRRVAAARAWLTAWLTAHLAAHLAAWLASAASALRAAWRGVVGLRLPARTRAFTAPLSRRLSIRLRLTLLAFTLVAILVGALGALISLSEQQTLITTQATDLRREAHLAADELHGSLLGLAHDDTPLPPLATNIPEGAYLPLTFLAQRLTSADTQAVILSTDGVVKISGANFYRVYGVTPPAAVSLKAPTARKVFAGPPSATSYLIARDTARQAQLVTLIPIEDLKARQTIAALQISTPMQPIYSAVNTTRLIVAISVAIALGLAAAIMFPLVGAGLRPLVAMERMSQRIANGALSLRLQEAPPNDEIGRLARSFNSMVEQLETAFLRQERFVADVSHELRTPLTALSGELEMLLLGADRGDVEAVRRLSRGMFAEVSRMRRLVEDLLTLTRLDDGQARFERQPVAVEPLMREMARQAERLARGQGITCSVAPQTPAISADPDHLRQVLLNVIENAAKYTPVGGQIHLSARRDAEPDMRPGAGPAERADAAMVVIAVADTGVGIAAAALPHVFERFYRADPARARVSSQVGGAGLGLSIARSLVEAQGGQISIASEEGSGTTVSVRFPVSDEPPPAPTSDSSDASAPERRAEAPTR